MAGAASNETTLNNVSIIHGKEVTSDVGPDDDGSTTVDNRGKRSRTIIEDQGGIMAAQSLKRARLGDDVVEQQQQYDNRNNDTTVDQGGRE